MMDSIADDGSNAIQQVSTQLASINTAAGGAANAVGVVLRDGPDLTHAIQAEGSARNRGAIAVPVKDNALVAHTPAGAAAANARVRPAYHILYPGIQANGNFLNQVGLDPAAAARSVAFQVAPLDGQDAQVDNNIVFSNMRPASGADPLAALVATLEPIGYVILRTPEELHKMRSPISFEFTSSADSRLLALSYKNSPGLKDMPPPVLLVTDEDGAQRKRLIFDMRVTGEEPPQLVKYLNPDGTGDQRPYECYGEPYKLDGSGHDATVAYLGPVSVGVGSATSRAFMRTMEMMLYQADPGGGQVEVVMSTIEEFARKKQYTDHYKVRLLTYYPGTPARDKYFYDTFVSEEAGLVSAGFGKVLFADSLNALTLKQSSIENYKLYKEVVLIGDNRPGFLNKPGGGRGGGAAGALLMSAARPAQPSESDKDALLADAKAKARESREQAAEANIELQVARRAHLSAMESCEQLTGEIDSLRRASGELRGRADYAEQVQGRLEEDNRSLTTAVDRLSRKIARFIALGGHAYTAICNIITLVDAADTDLANAAKGRLVELEINGGTLTSGFGAMVDGEVDREMAVEAADGSDAELDDADDDDAVAEQLCEQRARGVSGDALAAMIMMLVLAGVAHVAVWWRGALIAASQSMQELRRRLQTLTKRTTAAARSSAATAGYRGDGDARVGAAARGADGAAGSGSGAQRVRTLARPTGPRAADPKTKRAHCDVRAGGGSRVAVRMNGPVTGLAWLAVAMVLLCQLAMVGTVPGARVGWAKLGCSTRRQGWQQHGITIAELRPYSPRCARARGGPPRGRPGWPGTPGAAPPNSCSAGYTGAVSVPSRSYKWRNSADFAWDSAWLRLSFQRLAQRMAAMPAVLATACDGEAQREGGSGGARVQLRPADVAMWTEELQLASGLAAPAQPRRLLYAIAASRGAASLAERCDRPAAQSAAMAKCWQETKPVLEELEARLVQAGLGEAEEGERLAGLLHGAQGKLERGLVKRLTRAGRAKPAREGGAVGETSAEAS